MFCNHTRRQTILAAAAIFSVFATEAYAQVTQTAPDSSSQTTQQQTAAQDPALLGAGIPQLVTLYEKTPEKICAAVTPIIIANPANAADLITQAAVRPQLRPRLAQCLSQIQRFLKTSDPEAAKAIAVQVAAAPAEFQAEYAVALTDGNAGGGDAGGTAGNGTVTGSSFLVFNFGGFNGTPGVSKSTP